MLPIFVHSFRTAPHRTALTQCFISVDQWPFLDCICWVASCEALSHLWLFRLLRPLVEATHLGADLNTTFALDKLHGLLVALRQHLTIGLAEIKAKVEL